MEGLGNWKVKKNNSSITMWVNKRNGDVMRVEKWSDFGKNVRYVVVAGGVRPKFKTFKKKSDAISFAKRIMRAFQ